MKIAKKNNITIDLLQTINWHYNDQYWTSKDIGLKNKESFVNKMYDEPEKINLEYCSFTSKKLIEGEVINIYIN